MRTRTAARLYAVVVIGLIWAAIWWQINLARHAHGKEAFLSAQARRFDMFSPRFTGSFVAADIASAIVDILESLRLAYPEVGPDMQKQLKAARQALENE